MNDNGYINYVVHPPYYKKLCSFEWVDDYLALQDIKRELKFLTSKVSEVQNAQSTKETVKARFKASFERYQQRRIGKLTKILEGLQRHADPFFNLEYRLMGRPEYQRLGVSLTWPEIEQAIDLIQFDDDPLTDAEKESRLADLEKAIGDLKAKMQEHSPPGYFLIREGRIDCDSREKLVEHWRTIQGKCNAPCTPQGFALETGSDAEKDAYKKLGLSSAINSNKHVPDPHPRHEEINGRGTDFVPKR